MLILAVPSFESGTFTMQLIDTIIMISIFASYVGFFPFIYISIIKKQKNKFLWVYALWSLFLLTDLLQNNKFSSLFYVWSFIGLFLLLAAFTKKYKKKNGT